MNMMTAVAAVPAVALLPPPAAASPVGASEWDAEYARFKKIDDEYRLLCDAEFAACDAVYDECPREDRFFDLYGLGIGMKREAVVWHATESIANREGFAGWVVYPKARATISEQTAQAIRDEAERVADEFMAYQTRHDEAWSRHRVDELRERTAQYRDVWFEARDRFMRVPAPNVGALLVKFEIAGTWVDDDYVTGSFADARRLLGQGVA